MVKWLIGLFAVFAVATCHEYGAPQYQQQQAPAAQQAPVSLKGGVEPYLAVAGARLVQPIHQPQQPIYAPPSSQQQQIYQFPQQSYAPPPPPKQSSPVPPPAYGLPQQQFPQQTYILHQQPLIPDVSIYAPQPPPQQVSPVPQPFYEQTYAPPPAQQPPQAQYSYAPTPQQQPTAPFEDYCQRNNLIGGYHSQGCNASYFACTKIGTSRLQCPMETFFDVDSEICDYEHHIPACGGKRPLPPQQQQPSYQLPQQSYIPSAPAFQPPPPAPAQQPPAQQSYAPQQQYVYPPAPAPQQSSYEAPQTYAPPPPPSQQRMKRLHNAEDQESLLLFNMALFTNEGKLFCGAVAVAPHMALTAAHCLLDPETGMRTSIGEFYMLSGTIFRGAGKYITPKEIYMNPQFEFLHRYPFFYRFDLALIVTEEELDGIIAMKEEDVAPGTTVTMIGFGETHWGLYPSKLQTLNSQIVNERGMFGDGEYDDAYKYYTFGIIDHGDSGSGMLVTVDNKYYVVGICSRVDQIGEKKYASTYIKISKHFQWIEQIREKFGK